MTLDISQRASALGVSFTYKDFREGAVQFLPQRVQVVGHAQTGIVFPAGKWLAGSAGEAGARYGYKSQVYHALRQLLPVNGDGLGTIPVDVTPLSDAGGAVAAAGDVTPSGTATKSGAYRLRVGGVLSEEFVIPAGAIVVNDVLRKMGTALAGVLEIPCVEGYTYGTVTAGALVGTGNGTLTGLAISSGKSPKPGAWTLKVVTAVANGGVWSLTDPDGVVVETALTQTVGAGTATPFVNKGGLDFTITDAATDFGLGATFTITVPATKLTLTAPWKGVSGNSILIEVIGESLGVSFAITQMTGGLVNPSVQPALDAVGETWATMLLNCLNIEDTVALDAYQTWGEGRWGDIPKKPAVVFTGNTIADMTAATAVCSTRRTDRINSQLVAPGSVNMPFVVAARQLARIAKIANNTPAVSYQAQRATGIIPGTDAQQWDNTKRDQAIKLGSSTIEVKDSVVNLADIVTFYRPTGEEPPAYRKVVNIVKLQNISYNFQLEFAKQEWAAAPLVTDDDPVVLPEARKPKDAKTKANAILVELGKQAIITNVAAAKARTDAKINSQDPDRLDITVEPQLSGNTDRKGVEIKFGFYFGGAAAA